jgi:hypothetical protein
MGQAGQRAVLQLLVGIAGEVLERLVGFEDDTERVEAQDADAGIGEDGAVVLFAFLRLALEGADLGDLVGMLAARGDEGGQHGDQRQQQDQIDGGHAGGSRGPPGSPGSRRS